jgi:hypothetical protein
LEIVSCDLLRDMHCTWPRHNIERLFQVIVSTFACTVSSCIAKGRDTPARIAFGKRQEDEKAARACDLFDIAFHIRWCAFHEATIMIMTWTSPAPPLWLSRFHFSYIVKIYALASSCFYFQIENAVCASLLNVRYC